MGKGKGRERRGNLRTCSAEKVGKILHRNSCPETYRFPVTNKIPHHMLNSPLPLLTVRCFSLDLLPLEFFLWGHMMSVSYETRGIRKRPAGDGMDVGLPPIGDRVYSWPNKKWPIS